MDHAALKNAAGSPQQHVGIDQHLFDPLYQFECSKQCQRHKENQWLSAVVSTSRLAHLFRIFHRRDNQKAEKSKSFKNEKSRRVKTGAGDQKTVIRSIKLLKSRTTKIVRFL
jgi:hypothetical protein